MFHDWMTILQILMSVPAPMEDVNNTTVPIQMVATIVHVLTTIFLVKKPRMYW